MRAARTDSTHREVIDRLLAYGWLVFDTHALPNFVDCVAYGPPRVLWRHAHLIEIKSAKGQHTDSQKALMKAGWSILTLRSAADVDALMGVK